MPTTLNLSHFWAQGDAVSHALTIILLVLSLASWTIILARGWQLWQLRRRSGGALDAFWHAPTLAAGQAGLTALPPFGELAARGHAALQHFESHAAEAPHLDAHLSLSELATRNLRQGINHATSRLEAGQTFLASVGSTAPFIGLFGTVWGIYHALARIGIEGQASLDKVAGPVGEALIMTAAGLFVAIPAVLAYNTFNRMLRVIAADLDGFAHDLHTYLTTGRAMPQGNRAAMPSTNQAAAGRLAEAA